MSTELLFAGSIDDAALFPPESAPMPVAVENHVRHRAAWYAWLVGPMLCPSSRTEELAARIEAPLPVRLVIDSGAGGIGPAVDAVASDDRLILQGVEIALPPDSPADAARRAVAALDAAVGGPDDDEPAYVEPARSAGWRDALEVIAESGYRAKLRTGGPTPEALPTERTVAEFVLACLDLGISFKCTAGLHRAARHTAADGSEQHGFLNILLAVAACLDGADVDEAVAVLADRDGSRLASRLTGFDDGRARGLRRWFTSFGSCSVREPIQDLVALGLVRE
ncbi:MAG TPA: hypothetical protein VFP03_08835 [Jiangellaceae bacterium]|nr:hypothetical protein [Jiangellaceae bacterium]